MITAVDTNVLLDVFAADPDHGDASRRALSESLLAGQVVLCDVVWAETTAAFPNGDSAMSALAAIGAAFSPLDARAASVAGTAWHEYRTSGGPRTRVVADFLIGGHAAVTADRLLTRDRGFYRRYFERLEVVDPSR